MVITFGIAKIYLLYYLNFYITCDLICQKYANGKLPHILLI